jgi:spermidine/putrescine transport system substrate-binding protein
VRLFIVSLSILLFVTSCGPTANIAPTATTPPLAAEITMYGWGDDISPDVLTAFAEEYGVQINYVSYVDQDTAAADIRSGSVYDVVVMSNELVQLLGNEGLLAEIDHSIVTNFRNISPNFRDLAYDPQNRYSVPYNWGTNGLIVRTDLLSQPIRRWADVWNLADDQRIVMWPLPRYGVGAALKSLGYSINSEDEGELEQARQRLLELRPHVFLLGDTDYSVAPYLLDGSAVVGMNAGVNEALEGQEENTSIEYVLPEDGAILWGDNFVIPANSTNRYTALVFLNYLLQPENGVMLTEWNQYASPNDATRALLDSTVLSNQLLYPSSDQLRNAEILLPLSPEIYQRYLDIWNQFVAAGN